MARDPVDVMFERLAARLAVLEAAVGDLASQTYGVTGSARLRATGHRALADMLEQHETRKAA
jgi:hypothetical protein